MNCGWATVVVSAQLWFAYNFVNKTINSGKYKIKYRLF